MNFNGNWTCECEETNSNCNDCCWECGKQRRDFNRLPGGVQRFVSGGVAPAPVILKIADHVAAPAKGVVAPKAAPAAPAKPTAESLRGLLAKALDRLENSDLTVSSLSKSLYSKIVTMDKNEVKKLVPIILASPAGWQVLGEVNRLNGIRVEIFTTIPGAKLNERFVK